MDAAFWGTFALLMIAMCLTVTGELLLKTGMNRHGELNVSASTIVPTAIKLFTNPFVLGGFVFVFSGALFWLASAGAWTNPVYTLALMVAAFSWFAYVVRDRSPKTN